MEPFDYLRVAQAVNKASEWRVSLDTLLKGARAGLVFDNIAIYKSEPGNLLNEVIYARAMGRGQSAEADAAWGEVIANQVSNTEKLVIQQPEHIDAQGDRLSQACLLGVPLKTPGKLLGVLALVRFGGPPFTDEHIYQAEFLATQISFLLERRAFMTELDQLEDARRTMQLQQDFISTVSHELRTPLGFIKGYSTTLLRNDTSWDQATQREFLTIIDEEADHLAHLIENVLESARLQSNTLPMNFQPARIDTIIRDVAMRLQVRHKELQIKMSLPAIIIHADTVRISQVIENLMSNAVKYAPGSPIEVTASQEDDNIHIKVKDSGAGIPQEHIPFIFDRFYRVPGQSASGTGLGLFICKQIIIAHQGKIWVESAPETGTVFHILLPIRRQAS